MRRNLIQLITIVASFEVGQLGAADVVFGGNETISPEYMTGPPHPDYDRPPKLIRGNTPWYKLDPQHRVTGKAVVQFTIDETGKTGEYVFVSSTNRRLEKYIEWTLQDWLFEPAMKDEKPIKIRVEQEFNIGGTP